MGLPQGSFIKAKEERRMGVGESRVGKRKAEKKGEKEARGGLYFEKLGSERKREESVSMRLYKEKLGAIWSKRKEGLVSSI